MADDIKCRLDVNPVTQVCNRFLFAPIVYSRFSIFSMKFYRQKMRHKAIRYFAAETLTLLAFANSSATILFTSRSESAASSAGAYYRNPCLLQAVLHHMRRI